MLYVVGPEPTGNSENVIADCGASGPFSEADDIRILAEAPPRSTREDETGAGRTT
jgi:hypothetical protein